MSTPVGSYDSLDAVAAASAAKDASPGFQVVGPNPKVTFSVNNVPPPSPLYVTVNDVLELRVFNLNPSIVNLDLRTRVLTPEGEIKYDIVTTPTLPSDGTLTSVRYQLGEGFLLSVTVVGAPSGTQAGDCFTQVVINRAPGINGPTFVELIADYVTLSHFPVWPGGPIIKSVDNPGSFNTITIPDPGAVPSFTITCPANTRWNVMSLFFIYSVGAAVATRTPRVRLIDSVGRDVFNSGFTVGQGPSTGRNYSVGTACPFGLLADTLGVVGPLPSRVLMSAADAINVQDFNWQPGDSFTNVALRVEQWIDV